MILRFKGHDLLYYLKILGSKVKPNKLHKCNTSWVLRDTYQAHIQL